MRNLSYIGTILALVLTTNVINAETRSVRCGESVEISASPMNGFSFSHWSDGDTNAVRTIEIFDNIELVAYFEETCAEFTSLPIVIELNWIIMFDMKSCNQEGYYFKEENVTWYRVVGDVDNLHNEAFPYNDEVVGHGYCLALGHSLIGTGMYYAVIDMSSNSQGQLCDGFVRSEVVDFSGNTSDTSTEDSDITKPMRSFSLVPSLAHKNSTITLLGLDPDEESKIQIYSLSGQLVRSFETRGSDSAEFISELSGGCYQVRVITPTITQTLRFIVL